MYFEKLLKKINNQNLLENIINPFSLYFLCDHYYGNETKLNNINIPSSKNDILNSNNLSLIKDYDIIHVQVNFFEKFCDEILNKINKKIILTTGQWHLPQIKKNNFTEYILNHSNVVLWISQNPIYEKIEKYIAFPYGICHSNLQSFKDALLNYNINKDKNILHLHLGKNHPCRKKLPELSITSSVFFYEQITKAKFLISPIGDRDDCYRHYEAIGLGCIPISNVSNEYKQIFENNMYYTDIDNMVDILNKDDSGIQYREPNKDLICFDYHKDYIYSLIDSIKRLE